MDSTIRMISAQRYADALTTIETREDISFPGDIAALVRYRFPAARKALSQQLGESIAEKRRILLQRKLRIRRAPQAVSVPCENKDARLKPQAAIDQQAQCRESSGPTAIAGVTEASQPVPQALALRQLQAPSRRPITAEMSIFTTTQHDSFDYPPSPKVIQGQARVQCPFCFMALEQRSSEAESLAIWKNHVDEHIMPYICIFPECAISLVSFVSRQEWLEHMEAVHSTDWLRKVHITTWYCKTGHKSPLTFESELELREHMLDPVSHPGKTPPTEAQLDVLYSGRRQRIQRDEFVCPLCEQIPEEARKLKTACADPIQVYNSVVDHVASHLKSLSLMAIPSFGDADDGAANHDENSSVFTEDSLRRPLNADSLPLLPSGQDTRRGSPLPAGDWSSFRHDIISRNIQEGWDDEFVGYKQPDEPSEPSGHEWLEQWHQWKDELDNDFKDSALAWASSKGYEGTVKLLLENGTRVDAAYQVNGRTPLSWAASGGHEDVVEYLIDAGSDIDSADARFGRTSLNWAALRNQAGVVRLLLQSGAQVDAVDKSHRTPLSWASEKGHAAVVDLLLKSGAEIEARDPRHEQTPLSLAAAKGHENVVQLLLAKNAKVGATDSKGWTALNWAIDQGHHRVINLFVSYDAERSCVS
ncbi:transcription factor Zn, C2H2 [Fusarium austroafricanum]|uniref:Transcription factor Zn, C2H2 n=1 Tax=Fusarium austroafricanum TaxID=2364996 RepID=A0A8H4NX00_9HYPO|nr:transcription factor Zn, C2H2 [Fusarium austroafricanum]